MYDLKSTLEEETRQLLAGFPIGSEVRSRGHFKIGHIIGYEIGSDFNESSKMVLIISAMGERFELYPESVNLLTKTTTTEDKK